VNGFFLNLLPGWGIENEFSHISGFEGVVALFAGDVDNFLHLGIIGKPSQKTMRFNFGKTIKSP